MANENGQIPIWNATSNGWGPTFLQAGPGISIAFTPGAIVITNTGGGGDPSAAWPIGSIFISVSPTNPATSLGFGTWEAFATGRVLVSLNAADPDFDTVEEVGGAKTVTLSSAEMPAHTHLQDAHGHAQNAHNHTQDSHNHTQNAHAHVQSLPTSQTGSQNSGTRDTSTTGSGADALSTATTVATNQTTTATNQAATATNQNTTAVNQSTGGGGAHGNLQPYIVVFMWKRTA